MWQFREKVCPKCGIDLTGVKPERIREDVPQPYSVCPSCGHIRTVVDIKAEPASKPEAEAPETSEAEPTEPSEPAT